MFATLLTLHILGATIWTGGHLVLALAILPRVLRERDVAFLTAFESRFERIGIPALLTQIATGLWLAYRALPDVGAWFGFEGLAATHIGTKLGLLGLTIALAAHARLRLIPGLDGNRLPLLAAHIIAVTVVSVLFVIVGVGFRTGGVLP